MEISNEKIRISPSLKRLLRIWVVGVGILIVIAPTDIPALNRFIACFILFLFFWAAYFPFKVNDQSQTILVGPIRAFSTRKKTILVFLQFVFTEIAARFYTGGGLIDGIMGMLQGANTYWSYQEFFSEAMISSQPAYTRLHIILLLTIGKLIFVAITCEFYFRSDRKSVSSMILILLSTVIYMSFGLSRGTFFEVFEVAIANVYFTMLSSRLKPVSVRKITFSILKRLALLMLPTLFILNVMRRYDDPTKFQEHLCSSNFCFEPYNIFFIFEHVTYVTAIYFSNGIYSVSVFYENVLSGNVVEYLVPLYSYFLHDTDAIGVKGLLCERYLNCRFVWMSDLTIFISIFGVAAFWVVPVFIRKAHRLEFALIKKGTMSSYIFLFYLAVFIISLPVGNFITVSSTNSLAMIITFVASQSRFKIKRLTA